jgi:HAD superfamily hydrolase (TIGR01490 family)
MRAPAHPERPILAVFDFDGTLTTRDTSLPFLAFAAGRARLTAAMMLRGPVFLAGLTLARARAGAPAPGWPALRDRWELSVHDRLLRALFHGRSAAELDELGRRFADEALDAMVAPEALAQVAWHRARLHRCVLVTGSLETYMEPWGLRAGFERVLASRLARDRARRTVVGGFDGEPCWGDAKLARLREAVGSLDRYTLVVYGNEPGDRALLDVADHAVRVRPGESWARLAAGVRDALHAA